MTTPTPTPTLPPTVNTVGRYVLHLRTRAQAVRDSLSRHRRDVEAGTLPPALALLTPATHRAVIAGMEQEALRLEATAADLMEVMSRDVANEQRAHGWIGHDAAGEIVTCLRGSVQPWRCTTDEDRAGVAYWVKASPAQWDAAVTVLRIAGQLAEMEGGQ